MFVAVCNSQRIAKNIQHQYSSIRNIDFQRTIASTLTAPTSKSILAKHLAKNKETMFNDFFITVLSNTKRSIIYFSEAAGF